MHHSIQTLGNISEAIDEVLDVFASFGQFGSLLLALLVFLAGMYIAKLIGKGVGSALKRAEIDQKIASKLGVGEEGLKTLEEGIGKTVYLVLLLFVLMFAVDIAGADGVLQPIEKMLSEFFSYIPALLGGVLLAVLGYYVAKIVRELLTTLLKGLKLDERLKLGSEDTLAKAIGNIAYALILLLFLPAVLNAMKLDGIAAPVSDTVSEVLAAIPRILFAAVIFGIGYFVAKLVKDIVFNLLTSLRFDSVPEKLGYSGTIGKGAKSPSSLVASTVLAVIVVIFTAQALDVLEVGFLAGLSENLVQGFFQLLGALVILGIGLFAANVAGKQLDARSVVLATVAKVAIIAFAGFMALQTLGLATSISESTWLILLGAIAVAFGVGGAIAIGWGGHETVKKALQKRVEPKL